MQRDPENTNIPSRILPSGHISLRLNRKILSVALLRLRFCSIGATKSDSESRRDSCTSVISESLKRIVISAIAVYQAYISPLLPRTCRFYPSCSHYSVQSLQKHGLFKGAWLTVLRLLKCHPFHPGGYDPVK